MEIDRSAKHLGVGGGRKGPDVWYLPDGKDDTPAPESDLAEFREYAKSQKRIYMRG